MPLLHAIILGIVQGLTEFLPVSSSAHLALIPWLLGWNDQGLSFDIALHVGTVAAVIGGGNSAMDAALLVERYAAKVYLINITAELRGEESMLEAVKRSTIIKVMNNTRVTAVHGEKFVTGLAIDAGGAAQELSVQGIFVEIGSVPSVDFDSLTEKNKYAEIILHTDGLMTNLTSVPGIFAAGDVTDIPEKQISVAAGEGAKAMISIFQYLHKQGGPE